jgi:predicted ribosome quality control (RQC) complex YloA/Tae2 family protein
LGFSPVDSKRRADLSLELQIVVQKIYDLEVQTPKEIDQIRQNYNNKLERQRQDYEDKIDQLESEEQELKRKISLSEKSRP